MPLRDLLARPFRSARLGRLALVLLALALVVAYVAWPRSTVLERATSLLPTDVVRVAWTDWSGLRAELECEEFAACEGDLADRDLSSASVITSSADDLARQLHWGPDQVEWELLGQSPDGQVLVVELTAEASVDDVAEAYRAAGFVEPDEDALEGAVWTGGPDVVAALGLGEGVLGNVAIVEDERLLLLAEDVDYLEKAVAAREGDGLDFPLARRVSDPLAAVGFVGDYACSELSFADADPGAAASAERLVDEAGGVTPLDGYLVALGADRAWTAAFAFEEGDQADRDARSRRALAGADDPGQGISYPDAFTVESAEVDGDDVVLRGRAAESAYALTETTQGPVLLASC